MMLCLQLVDVNCNLFFGYEIEVWYCDVEGIYFGDISDSSDVNGFSFGFCIGNDQIVLVVKWFCGIKVMDSVG